MARLPQWRAPSPRISWSACCSATRPSGFFDEKHTIEELLERGEEDGDLTAKTKLNFFLRSWKAPSPVSEQYTGKCIHHWRVREVDGDWRVAAQMVERFEDLNDNSKRLFATPDEGLNR
jgi:hypothetical protein